MTSLDILTQLRISSLAIGEYIDPFVFLSGDTEEQKYESYLKETFSRIHNWSAAELDYYARETEDLIKKENDPEYQIMLPKLRMELFSRAADRLFVSEEGYTLVERL